MPLVLYVNNDEKTKASVDGVTTHQCNRQL